MYRNRSMSYRFFVLSGFLSLASTLMAGKTVYTTDFGGSPQNLNLYTLKADAFIRDEIAGTYYFEVTTPNGLLLSTDNASCRQIVVNGSGQANTDLSGGCKHAVGINGNAVQLIP